MPEGDGRRAEQASMSHRLSLIRERHKDRTTPEAVADVVETVLWTLHGELSRAEATLLSEVEQIGSTIAAAKREIATLHVEDINGTYIPSATDELDAIVEATARATNEILDACETFEEVSAGLEGEAAARLQAATTRIYEACSFQDITGQRITKIVGTLKTIEERIAAIIDTFAERIPGDAAEARPAAEAAPEDEPGLLNGPQLPGNGVDQAEIDRLLASFD